MNVYLTSDLHLGHTLASKCRGFDTVLDHDIAVIKSLDKVCKNNRTLLYILGDVAMSKGSLSLLSEIKGRKILVRGNHDVYPLENYLKYFEDVLGIIKYKNMWLSHCPIHPQEMYRCEANVHGHIHKNTDSPCLGYPYININWDFWERPLSLEEIRTLIKNKTDGITC